LFSQQLDSAVLAQTLFVQLSAVQSLPSSHSEAEVQQFATGLTPQAPFSQVAAWQGSPVDGQSEALLQQSSMGVNTHARLEQLSTVHALPSSHSALALQQPSTGVEMQSPRMQRFCVQKSPSPH
jgi:hypothetical protein